MKTLEGREGVMKQRRKKGMKRSEANLRVLVVSCLSDRISEHQQALVDKKLRVLVCVFTNVVTQTLADLRAAEKGYSKVYRSTIALYGISSWFRFRYLDLSSAAHILPSGFCGICRSLDLCILPFCPSSLLLHSLLSTHLLSQRNKT